MSRKSHTARPRPRAVQKPNPFADAAAGRDPTKVTLETISDPLHVYNAGYHEGYTARRLLETDSATRKRYPITEGFLDYFPDAVAAVAEVSYLGNQKHNPGEPMHHARGKSMDHADCIGRHLIERGGFDGGIRHSAALAWRAMALLQEELEREFALPLPRGARVQGR